MPVLEVTRKTRLNKLKAVEMLYGKKLLLKIKESIKVM